MTKVVPLSSMLLGRPLSLKTISVWVLFFGVAFSTGPEATQSRACLPQMAQAPRACRGEGAALAGLRKGYSTPDFLRE
jgi:hypothetical protein